MNGFTCAKCDNEISRFDDKYNYGFCNDCYLGLSEKDKRDIGVEE